MPKETSFTTALLSGGCAGTSVDVALFPLDTIKTRLQVGSQTRTCRNCMPDIACLRSPACLAACRVA
jgi:hypothetical protein